MRAVVQRVCDASVTVEGEVIGAIDRGLLVYLGVAAGDAEADSDYLAEKIATLRIYPDAEERMNLSVSDLGLSVLVVSQFTLLADVRKGRRPSWSGAAPNELAKPLYEHFCARVQAAGLRVATGRFQAVMRVAYVNEGPVTILLDSRKAF